MLTEDQVIERIESALNIKFEKGYGDYYYRFHNYGFFFIKFRRNVQIKVTGAYGEKVAIVFKMRFKGFENEVDAYIGQMKLIMKMGKDAN